MDTEFAGCCDKQSGQRFLDSSAPRLIRHVASCKAAGGAHSLPAGKEEKLSWGFGGKAPIGRVAPVPYLACRNTEQSKQPERSRFCGVWTLRGTVKGGPGHKPSVRGPGTSAIAPGRRYVRLRCKCWSCSECGPRKASRYRGQILRAVGRYKLKRMLTLTVDVRKFASAAELETFQGHFQVHKSLRVACRCITCSALQGRSIAHIRECWNKLRLYMGRKYGAMPAFISVLEFQKATGMAHLHVVLNRWVDQAWVKESWQALGGGQHVDIRQIDAHRAAAYLSKYLSKEMFVNAPPGMRRVTTSRSIRLGDRKASGYVWEIVKAPINRFYVVLWEAAEDIVRSDGELQSFAVRE
jgi:hypothetical protein